ncbi:unnamed protein product [Adineta steineri]|uniref:Enhancer of mRNA-decapping protein 4 C-terminal domain-containing protein n=1 Tax=Adineta steineri TaxID=433720 RepID=A0A814J3A7_9BILA|nr:unnamed protein product [Adineta steineri]
MNCNFHRYSIDDLLTPDSSLTNITGLANGDTARSLLASHDGLTTNSHPASTMDPLHGLLLGNTTAFDAITTQQQEHRTHTSPSQKQIAAVATTSPNNRFQSSGNTDLDSSRLIINGISQSPYDLADKEVAESMSCSTNYPLPFEALPDDDNDDVDVVFMPIKTITDDEPVNGGQDALLSSQKYSDNSLWSKQSPIKGLNTSNRQDIDDYSDPTETSDKDDDSTADEEDLLHTRIKRRSGRSPNSAQLILNNDSLHEIRQLTRVLNELQPPVGDLINLPPPYSIDDLLTPDSSLTNITGLANGDTARSLLASHDGLTTNSHPTATMDPLHGLLLGNTTAFDAITTQQQEHRTHTSPSQKQIAAAATTSPNNRFQSSGNTDLDSSRLIINGISQSPYDLADKEVAESMSCSTNYPLPFEALPDDDNDDVDAVFMPIKTITDDEPVNGSQDALLSSQKYSDNSLWSKQSPIKGLNASNRQDIDDYSDPTETSDKDDDSTADEEDLLHTRIKRRSGRSPNSSQLILNNDSLHEIRQLTPDEEDLLHTRIKRRSGRSPNSAQLILNNDSLHEIRQLTRVLNELRTRTTNLASESMSQITSDSYNDDKLDHCCQRLEQLTSKVDRLLSFEPSSVVSRQSRPSPNSFPLDIVANNESQTTLSDTHYDRLEAILIEKIQTYVQSAMKSVFEPYREMKDNLHKDLAAKLLSTDNVIRQTITQIFRSKTMVDSLSHAVSNAIQTTMITSYRDTFNQIVIPSFEKAVTNMFQQTNDVFKRGTKEYLQEMIEYGRQQQRSLIQQREQMMSEIRKETTQLNKEFEKKNQELTNVLKHEITQHLTTNLTPLIRETTRSILREETASIFREVLATQKNDINTLFRQTAPLNPTVSRTATPVSTTNVASPSITNTSSPSDTKQQHVLKLIRLNQLNQAFEFVLSASDLSLVLYLCENVRPADLFSIQPCPLQTPVLLSLIQQLAADLTTKQELKYNYLHEALICLDLSHPSARDYSQNILIDLSKKLYEYIQTNPTTPLTKRFQVLFMATRSLIQKIVQQRATPLLSS